MADDQDIVAVYRAAAAGEASARQTVRDALKGVVSRTINDFYRKHLKTGRALSPVRRANAIDQAFDNVIFTDICRSRNSLMSS